MENKNIFNCWIYNFLAIVWLFPVLSKLNLIFYNKTAVLMEAVLVCFVPFIFIDAIIFNDKKSLTDYFNYSECEFRFHTINRNLF